jgi:MFS family permease
VRFRRHASIISLLLPLVEADSGGLAELWPLFGVAGLLLALFAWWEARTVRGGREPVLDPALLRTSGYPAGSGIGLIYFMAFTGVWLVLALFFQDGLGYSPLRSGLAVTPFAIGVAASAVIAGRLVTRVGRWVTVCGLTATAAGMAVTALVLRHVGGDAAAWAAAAPLLVAGLGGGMVTSPNLTLTLQNVPVRMAGAAGGALQTAQRIGSAIGTAVLVTIYYHVLTGHGYAAAVSDSLLLAFVLMLVALDMAIAELIRRRSDRVRQSVPAPRPEHHLHHL